MNKTEKKKILQDIVHKQDMDNFTAELNRARSVTVGTSFNGVTELMMRRMDGSVVWAIMQPVEVIELIHQLAANVGCHINLQPRTDFATYRAWKDPNTDLQLGAPPPPPPEFLPDEIIKASAKLPPPEEQPGLKTKRTKKNDVMAIKENINKRAIKRTSRTS